MFGVSAEQRDDYWEVRLDRLGITAYGSTEAEAKKQLGQTLVVWAAHAARRLGYTPEEPPDA